jgi:hypothetical protein
MVGVGETTAVGVAVAVAVAVGVTVGVNVAVGAALGVALGVGVGVGVGPTNGCGWTNVEYPYEGFGDALTKFASLGVSTPPT